MDETIISNWNSVVKDEDTVYHLGDFSFKGRSPSFYRRRLKGTVYLVWGNHDRKSQYGRDFLGQTPLTTLNFDGISVTLCHFAMRVWNKSHFDAWHLYGHSHGCLEGVGKSFDVGVDTHNFMPWSWEEIKREMKKLPHNFNWVGNLPGYNEKEFEDERRKQTQ
jgi:calcineurin-like phosphoesterase family protein